MVRRVFLPILRPGRRLLAAALAAMLIWPAFPLGAFPAGETEAQDSPPPPADNTLVDEEPAPLAPQRPRSEQEQDRVEADALFAHGRLLQQKNDLAGALRRYQRAWRRHPDAAFLLKEIVSLALSVNRPEEATRYAVISAERTAAAPSLLRDLAKLLASQGDYRRAAALYERSFSEGGARDEGDVEARLMMGRLYFLESDFARAAESLAEVVKALEKEGPEALSEETRQRIEDDRRETYELFAETFLRAGRLEEAAAMFRKAHQSSGDNARLEYQLARVAFEAQAFDEALLRLGTSLESGVLDEGEDPYQLLYELELKSPTGPDEGAARKRVIARLAPLQTRPGQPAELHLFVARQHAADKDWPAAVAALEAAQKVRPTGAALVELASALVKSSQFEKLLAVLGEAAVMKGQGDVLGAIAEAQSIDGTALAELKRLAAEKGDELSPPVALALGVLSIHGGENGDEWFEAAWRAPRGRVPETLLVWGLRLALAGKHEQAVEVFRRAIRENAARAQADVLYLQLSAALEMCGRIDEALAAARRAAALQPTADNRMHVASLLERADRTDEAEREYRRLLERFDLQQADQSRLARMALSNLCVKAGRLPEAEEWLEQVLDSYPDDVGAMNDLGYLWVDQGRRLERSLAMIRRACAAEPKNAAYQDSLGWAFYRLGRWDEAIAALEAAVHLSPSPDGVILDHLGDAQAAAGRDAQALASWEKALQAAGAEGDQKLRERVEAKIASRGKSKG